MASPLNGNDNQSSSDGRLSVRALRSSAQAVMYLGPWTISKRRMVKMPAQMMVSTAAADAAGLPAAA